ncbi:hypothetical protein [Muricoccus aerilatus]|uniref:hypothetical protein n=1 Tax=Muricoccus aerilatus TaxID=452982 RepID=UPI0012EB3F05|nr:hypothetical protein [Roseomonas aerilata]
MDLQADSVQAVAFMAPGQQQRTALQLWEALFPGDAPDSFQRATGSTPSLASNAAGARDGHNIMITSQVGRIDIFLGKVPSADDAGPPRIADVQAAVTRAAGFLRVTADRVAPVRIALVLDLSKSIEGGMESTSLMELLPGVGIPPDATDVTLQFNVRRAFGVASEIGMNRLCSWAHAQIGMMTTPMMPGQLMQIPMANMKFTPIVNVKIDVNSAPEARLSSDLVPALIEELRVEALAIYEEGFARLQA